VLESSSNPSEQLFRRLVFGRPPDTLAYGNNIAASVIDKAKRQTRLGRREKVDPRFQSDAPEMGDVVILFPPPTKTYFSRERSK
jgi:hypothetical protein